MCLHRRAEVKPSQVCEYYYALSMTIAAKPIIAKWEYLMEISLSSLPYPHIALGFICNIRNTTYSYSTQ